jgi:hypothetical protein
MARNPIVESSKFGGSPLDRYDGPWVAKVKRLTYVVKCLNAVEYGFKVYIIGGGNPPSRSIY